jgi:hypothetical protein
MMQEPRGFTLLISILLATVAVTLGVSLLDLSYKQVILSSTAKQSQYGFYAADTAMECALYWDQKYNAFRFTSPIPSSTLRCQGNTVLSYTTGTYGSGASQHRKTEFNMRCGSTSTSNGRITVYKYTSGATTIYANGFSSCTAADQRRVERGLKVFY